MTHAETPRRRKTLKPFAAPPEPALPGEPALVCSVDVARGELLEGLGWDALLGQDPGALPTDVNWWLQHVHPEDRAAVATRYATLVTPGEGYRLDYRVVHRDGHTLDVREVGRVLRRGRQVVRQGSVQDLSAELRERRALREQAAALRQVLDHTLDAAYQRNIPEDRYEFLSPVFQRITGWSVEELTRASIEVVLGAVHPVDLPGLLAVMEQSNHQLGEGRVEYRFLGKDGQYRWLADHFQVLPDAQGQPLHRVGVVRDVTVLRVAEQERRASEERYRVLVETSPDAVAVHRDGRFLFANPAALALFGAGSLEQLAAHSAYDLVRAEDREVVRQRVARVMRGERGPLRETRVLRLDGTEVPVESTLAGVEFQGEPAVQVVARDIRERQQTQAALQETSALVREQAALLDQAPVVLLDLDGTVLLWSRGAEALYGWSRAEAMGRNLHDLLRTEFPQSLESMREQLTRTGRWEGELKHTCKDGSHRVVAALWVLRRTEQGHGAVLEVLNDVTARKQGEEALRSAERTHQRTLETLVDGVLMTDSTGTITFLNQSAARILGLRAELVLGQNILDGSWHGVDEVGRPLASERLPAARALRERREVAGMEYGVPLPDGTTRWLSANAAPLLDGRGNLQGAVVSFRDITERRQVDQALRTSEGRMNLAVLSAELGTYDYDLVRGRLVWSDRTNQHFGLPPHAEVDFPTFLRGIHPADREWVHTLIKETLTPGGSPCFQVEHRSVGLQDGRQRWLMTTGCAYFDAGRAVRLVGTTQDITARKLEEASLRVSELRARAQLSAMTAGLVVFETVGEPGRPPRDARVVDANTAFVHLVGRTREALLGRPFLEVLPGAGVDGLQAGGAVAVSGEPARVDWHLDLEGRHVEAQLFRPAPGQFAALLLDVTERQQMEAELHARALRENTAGRAWEGVLAALGHGLRNPLAPLRDVTFLLRQLAGKHPDLAAPVDILERQVTLLQHRVEDLLEVDRLGRRQVPAPTRDVDLAELVRSVTTEYRPRLEHLGLVLGVTLPRGSVPVRGDPARLAQALEHLLENAATFTPRGGTVAVGLRTQEDGRLALEVTDSGAGLAADQLQGLFQPYPRSGRDGGLGLGLALVRGVAELHHGSVGVSSPGRGKGSTFRLLLPPLSEGQRKGPGGAAGRRVLVIEDNADAAMSLRMLLEAFGHKVALAGDAAQGLEQARAQPPDMVLCDIALPGPLDGHDVARALRAERALDGTLLVALSGLGSAADRERAQAAGFDVHLTKPADPVTLDRLVRDAPRRVTLAG